MGVLFIQILGTKDSRFVKQFPITMCRWIKSVTKKIKFFIWPTDKKNCVKISRLVSEKMGAIKTWPFKASFNHILHSAPGRNYLCPFLQNRRH